MSGLVYLMLELGLSFSFMTSLIKGVVELFDGNYYNAFLCLLLSVLSAFAITHISEKFGGQQ